MSASQVAHAHQLGRFKGLQTHAHTCWHWLVQNGVHCGELCKCLDCANCDAAYALQSSQRMGTRKASAQAGAWHVAPGQDGGPITPFSTR
jgi:hypothetical protein